MRIRADCNSRGGFSRLRLEDLSGPPQAVGRPARLQVPTRNARLATLLEVEPALAPVCAGRDRTPATVVTVGPPAPLQRRPTWPSRQVPAKVVILQEGGSGEIPPGGRADEQQPLGGGPAECPSSRRRPVLEKRAIRSPVGNGHSPKVPFHGRQARSLSCTTSGVLIAAGVGDPPATDPAPSGRGDPSARSPRRGPKRDNLS